MALSNEMQRACLYENEATEPALLFLLSINHCLLIIDCLHIEKKMCSLKLSLINSTFVTLLTKYIGWDSCVVPTRVGQSAGAVEYADDISAEG